MQTDTLDELLVVASPTGLLHHIHEREEVIRLLAGSYDDVDMARGEETEGVTVAAIPATPTAIEINTVVHGRCQR